MTMKRNEYLGIIKEIRVMKKTYQELRMNPPKISVKAGAREVIFKVVSSMCDNVYYFKFKKNEEGDFKLSTSPFAYSNFGIKHEKFELEWEADQELWLGVVAMINSGYQKVESVQFR